MQTLLSQGMHPGMAAKPSRLSPVPGGNDSRVMQGRHVDVQTGVYCIDLVRPRARRTPKSLTLVVRHNIHASKQIAHASSFSRICDTKFWSDISGTTANTVVSFTCPLLSDFVQVMVRYLLEMNSKQFKNKINPRIDINMSQRMVHTRDIQYSEDAFLRQCRRHRWHPFDEFHLLPLRAQPSGTGR